MNSQPTDVLTELTPTWEKIIRIWWAYLWRNFIAVLVSMIIAFIVVIIADIILRALQVPTNIIKIITMVIVFISSLIISVFPLKMIIGKKFRDFSLIIVKNEGL
jgi:hypothetical protein